MATINSAVNSGVLVTFQLPPWEERHPVRPLYASPDFFDWADSEPRLIDKKEKAGDRLLLEQMEQTFSDFRCAQKPSGGDLRRISPTKHGVWTMRPPSLRVYGWFCAKREFVAVCGALEKDTKTNKGLNDTKRNDVLDFIKMHQLQTTVVMGDLLAVL